MFCPNCGQENTNAFGYCTKCQRPLNTVGGAAAMPALAPPGRTRRLSRGAKISLVVAAVFALVAAIVIPLAGSFQPPEQRFARLMREAAGVQPESHHGFGRQRQLDDAVRAQYRRLLEQNREYIASVKQMDTSKVHGLNSSEAYLNPEAEQEGLAQLHALFAADADQEQKVQGIISDLREVLAKYAGSSGEREAMLRGFDDSVAKQFAKRQEAIAGEKAWVDAVDALHAYAGAHRDAFTTTKGHLIIRDQAVRSEFNAKVELQEEKRREFMQLQQQFSQAQAQSLE